MNDAVVLYSVQSALAFYINEEYYNKKHYAWCSPFFDYRTESRRTPAVPYTSNPKDIYNKLKENISIIDRHYNRSEIERNVMGLLRGAQIMREKERITESTYLDIKSIIKTSQDGLNIKEYFRPLLYVIPYKLNENLIKSVSVEDRALPFSSEYIIEELPSGNFSIIDYMGGDR